MKPLKFRAWVVDGLGVGKMAYFQLSDIRANNIYTDIGSVPWEHIQEDKIMQFIGLKDILGKEIYDKDFVLIRIRGYEKTHRIVKWSNVYLQWELRRKRVSKEMYYMYKYAVVGNAYENPEMLDEVLTRKDGVDEELAEFFLIRR